MENPFDSSPATGSHELKKNANEIFFLLTTFIKTPEQREKERKQEENRREWREQELENWSFESTMADAIGGAMTDSEAEVFGQPRVALQYTTSENQGSKEVEFSYIKRNELKFKDAAKIQSLLESYVAGGGNIDAQDEHGKTVLWYAFDEFHFDVAEILIASGADLNFRDKCGKTLVHYFGSNLASFDLLMKNGVKLNVKDKSGHSEIFYVLKKGKDFHQEFFENKKEYENQQRWLKAKASEYPGMPRKLTDLDLLPGKSNLVDAIAEAYKTYVSQHQSIFDYENADSEVLSDLSGGNLPIVYVHARPADFGDCYHFDNISWVENQDTLFRLEEMYWK